MSDDSPPLDLVDLHQRALDATGTIVGRVRDDQMGNDTPCDEWNVRQLLDHVIAGNWWASELAAGATIDDVGQRFDGDNVTADAFAAYEASAMAAQAAFGAPGAMGAPCAVSYGPVPGSVYCGHRFIDVLVHGWDLATATGQSTDLDPELVAACWAIAEPQAELLAGSGAFDNVVHLGDDAPPQQRLLALLGRS